MQKIQSKKALNKTSHCFSNHFYEMLHVSTKTSCPNNNTVECWFIIGDRMLRNTFIRKKNLYKQSEPRIVWVGKKKGFRYVIKRVE